MILIPEAKEVDDIEVLFGESEKKNEEKILKNICCII